MAKALNKTKTFLIWSMTLLLLLPIISGCARKGNKRMQEDPHHAESKKTDSVDRHENDCPPNLLMYDGKPFHCETISSIKKGDTLCAVLPGNKLHSFKVSSLSININNTRIIRASHVEEDGATLLISLTECVMTANMHIPGLAIRYTISGEEQSGIFRIKKIDKDAQIERDSVLIPPQE